MINSTIIIGLLVLLTLNSLSSPFVQEEQSAFFSEWYAVKQDLRITDKILLDCNEFLLDTTKDKIWDSFEISSKLEGIDDTDDNYSTRGDVEDQIITEWFLDYDENMTKKCHELPSEKFELTKKLDVLNNWGIEFHYLSYDSENSQIVESKYHKDLASGPFLTIMTNIGMIFPFLISIIVDTIINSRKDQDDNNASKIGIGLMIAGFVVMIVGLGIIGFSFYEASAPFLDF